MNVKHGRQMEGNKYTGLVDEGEEQLSNPMGKLGAGPSCMWGPRILNNTTRETSNLAIRP